MKIIKSEEQSFNKEGCDLAIRLPSHPRARSSRTTNKNTIKR